MRFSGHRGLLEYSQRARSDDIEVLSVDVFDTLLLRGARSELRRFLDVGELASCYLAREFGCQATGRDLFWLRVESARTAYRMRQKQYGAREANLEEILRTMLAALALPVNDDLVADIVKLELEYELGQLRPNVPLVDCLTAGREQGKRVVCISDMYLSSQQIRFLVEQNVGLDLIEDVYSSADFGYGKASGAIFSTVCEQLCTDPGAVLHCGDNYFSDMVMPLSRGLQACYTPRDLMFRVRRRLSHWRTRREMTHG